MGRKVLMSRAQRALAMLDQVFGRAVVVSIHGKNEHGKLQYDCLCECTKPFVALGTELRDGSVQSCGCLRKELAAKKAHAGGAANAARFTSHLVPA